MQPAIAYRDADSVNSAMYRVFVYMTLALLVTASVAGVVASSPALMALFFATWLKWPVIFAPLVAVLALNWYIAQGPSLQGARAALMGFGALFGISIATVFHTFSMGSVVFAFLASMILFAVLACWGYFTRRDLSGWQPILMSAVMALIIVAVLLTAA
jgi:FtsH-binding integral membrane protein